MYAVARDISEELRIPTCSFSLLFAPLNDLDLHTINLTTRSAVLYSMYFRHARKCTVANAIYKPDV